MKTLHASILLAILSASGAAHAVGSAELYTAKGYQFGRFEARLQFAPGDGVVSSFFLWKDGSETAGTFWNELDFEKLGADCHLTTNAFYGNPASNNNKVAAVTSSLCDQFHTYTYEWTPDYISWLVDGVEVRRETGDVATAFAQNTAAGMQIRFNVWPGDASFGGNFDPAILPVYEYVNWVQYSAYNNGAFEFKWRQDFNGTTVPSGWLTGNWSSPKNLSTHSPRNVGFANGNVVLALTADTALGTAGASAVDTTDPSPSTGGTSSTGTATGTSTSSTGWQTSTSTTSPAAEDGGGCTIAQASKPMRATLGLGLLLGVVTLARRRRNSAER
jgi:endo-1,3-1,4-beta-glycanase ExoK